MRKKILKYINLIKYLSFIIFSIYCCCIPTYQEYNWFIRLISAPFTEIMVKTTKIFGNNLFIGCFITFAIHFLIYGCLQKSINKKSEGLTKHSAEMEEIQKIPDIEERNKQLISFIKKYNINPFASFLSLLLIPFFYFSLRGMLSLPFNHGYFANETSTSFLWTDLLSYDKFLILPIIFLIGSIIQKLIEKKKEKYESNVSKYEKHLNNLEYFLLFLLLGCCVGSNLITYYLICNLVFNLIYKFAEKKGEKNEQ